MPLQIRRGTNTERQNMTVPLAPGEPLYTTDQGFLYIGDGTTLGGVQVTGYNDENAVDAVGSALVSGDHQNISFIYGQTQDVANRIDAVLDLSVYSGDISADSFKGNLLAEDDSIVFNSQTKEITVSNITITSGNLTSDLKGSVFADDSTILLDSTNSKINLDGTVKGNIVPDLNEVYDLGTSVRRFRDLYLSGSSLWLGDAQIRSTGTAVNLPPGSTINGATISVIEGDLNVNIVGDDSTIIVNASTKTVTALEGNFDDLQVNNILTQNNTVSIDTQILINQNDSNATSLLIEKTSNDTLNPPGLTFRRTKGTRTSEETVVNGDTLGTINFRSFDGSNDYNTASIVASVSAAVTPGSIPSSLRFFTTRSGGLLEECANFDSFGILNFRRSTPVTTVVINSAHDDAFTNGITFSRSRNTQISPQSVAENDMIGNITFSARSTTTPGVFPGVAASIRASIDGTVSHPVVPGRIEFFCQDTLGISANRMILKNDGRLQVDRIESLNGTLQVDAGSVNLSSFLKLPVYADDTARSTAIPTPSIGMVIFMTAGTSPAATNQPQYFNGTSWISL